MRFFFDIDGTLTNEPEDKWGKPYLDRIEKVKELIEKNHTVVVWSGNGTVYANEFCKKYGIKPYAAIGKPDFYYDDKEAIRAEGKMIFKKPEEIENIECQEKNDSIQKD